MVTGGRLTCILDLPFFGEKKYLTALSNVADNVSSVVGAYWNPWANRGMYWNPGTQAGAENKDFGTVTQMDLNRVKFHLRHSLLWCLSCILLGKNGLSEEVRASNCLQHSITKPPTLTSWLSTFKLNKNPAFVSFLVPDWLFCATQQCPRNICGVHSLYTSKW